MTVLRLLGLVLLAGFLGFCLLVSRNEYAWMDTSPGQPLPLDDAQSFKEALSLLGLGVAVAVQVALAALSRGAVWRSLHLGGAALAVLGWAALFWTA